jgi:hypothetical protein
MSENYTSAQSDIVLLQAVGFSESEEVRRDVLGPGKCTGLQQRILEKQARTEGLGCLSQ